MQLYTVFIVPLLSCLMMVGVLEGAKVKHRELMIAPLAVQAAVCWIVCFIFYFTGAAGDSRARLHRTKRASIRLKIGFDPERPLKHIVRCDREILHQVVGHFDHLHEEYDSREDDSRDSRDDTNELQSTEDDSDQPRSDQPPRRKHRNSRNGTRSSRSRPRTRSRPRSQSLHSRSPADRSRPRRRHDLRAGACGSPTPTNWSPRIPRPPRGDRRYWENQKWEDDSRWPDMMTAGATAAGATTEGATTADGTDQAEGQSQVRIGGKRRLGKVDRKKLRKPPVPPAGASHPAIPLAGPPNVPAPGK